jgi:hypothetical protein
MELRPRKEEVKKPCVGCGSTCVEVEVEVVEVVEDESPFEFGRLFIMLLND